jgi:hypothetical protein
MALLDSLVDGDLKCAPGHWNLYEKNHKQIDYDDQIYKQPVKNYKQIDPDDQIL